MGRALKSWEERYQREPIRREPSNLFARFSHLLPARGLALDVACGAGRNALDLARRGLRVIATDLSWNSIQRGRELAALRHLSVSWLRADLKNFAFPPATFDLVACFYYRDPNLYATFRKIVRPGGLVFLETYTRDQLEFDAGSHNPAHLLKRAELLEAFRDWEVILYRERWIEKGVASLVARKPSA